MPANYIEIECPICDETFKLEVEIMDAEPNYGADADGHRGIYIPAYATLVDDEPSACPSCKEEFYDTDLDSIRAQINKELNEINKEF